MSFAPPPRRPGGLDRPDCRIRYEVTGEGPPIVFAHALGTNLMTWWQQVAHFAPRYSCVAFSARGFFPSTAPGGGPDPAQYAGDVAALVDALDLGDVRMVCHSMGGWSGVEYALLRPGRVKALVLSASTGSLDPRQMPEPERSQLAAWNGATDPVRADLLARGINPATGPRMAEQQPALCHLYNQIVGLNGEMDRLAIRTRLHAMRTRPPESFAAARCPVLFVAAEEDVVIPPFAGPAMARVIPGAQAVTMRRAGHAAHFEHAAQFNGMVEAFFAAVWA